MALKVLTWFGVAGVMLTALLAVFGPQEGLETLATGLLMWFVLLYHLALLPLLIYACFRPAERPGWFPLVMIYYCCIYASGLWVLIDVNEIDQA
ncbi:MAG: hypothetical protein KDI36_12905, partial [Pseudomonadales bacterium]|nr:hypothetical protein [Pseudomonadales bacterium]